MVPTILINLLIVFAVAGVVVYLFQLLRLPAVVGLLVAGVLIGPFLRGDAETSHEIHLLAEIGVVVLLFSVGLEFSLSRVLGMSRLMPRTRDRENSSPTEKRRTTTPISARRWISWLVSASPRRNGPIRTPATSSPTTAGRRSSWNR